MKKYEPSFTDRLGTAAKARRAQLEKARENAPANDPRFAEQQSARRLVAEKRKVRLAERKAAKQAEEVRKAKDQAKEEIARAIALKAEEEARAAEEEERRVREIALAAERKAKRDRKYAARQARQR